MLIAFMLFWVGLTLSAPTWYWWCFGLFVFFNIVKFGFDMYKAGSK